MSILELARSNYVESLPLRESSFPEDSNRWPIFRAEMAQAIRRFANEAEAIRYAQTRGIFDHRVPAAGLPRDLALYRHVLRHEYPHYAESIDTFAESPHSVGESLAVLNGKAGKVSVSNVLYWHMFPILTCLTYKSQVARICEIGGGYGGAARLWLTNPIRSLENYTIIDLPESLFFAECFLRASLPDYRVVYCRSEADCDNSQAHTIYLVPHVYFGVTGRMKFDLICNTGSIGELSDDWGKFWADWICRQQCDVFYSHNYFGTPIDKLYEGRSVLSPRVPRGWRVAHLRINVPLQLLQSVERNAAELILVRAPSSASKRWIYEVQRFQEPEALSLRDFAYYVLNLPDEGEADVFAETRFLRRCLSSLKYFPKELLYLAKRISSSPFFEALAIADRALVEDLQSRLETSFRSNHPAGPFST
jgi:putative sugar O-methyltransferase